MTIDTTSGSHPNLSRSATSYLAHRIEQRKFNHEKWLGKFDDENPDPNSFPYRLKQKCGGNLENKTHHPDFSVFLSPTCQGRDPFYIINIPFVPPQSKNYSSINKIVEQIRDESFGTEAKCSRNAVNGRTVTMIGMNRYRSLDNAENRRFRRYVRNLPARADISINVIGKFWRPIWVPNSNLQNEYLYCPWKSFKLLKVLHPDSAKQVKEKFERSTRGLSKELQAQIPYQSIRDWILHSNETNESVSFVREKSGNRPIYIKIADSDSITLRPGNRGLLSIYDRIIRKQSIIPRLISTGYYFSEDEKLLLRMQIDLDNKVRRAITNHIPTGAYYPEPNMAFLLGDKEPTDFSFKGDRNDLESRRLIRSNWEYFNENAVFRAIPSLITTVPKRMRTDHNQLINTLEKGTLGKKKNLQALRGNSQSNATPYQWKQNVYMGLPPGLSVRKASVERELGYILNVFDPISLFYKLHPRYDYKRFDHFLNNYKTYLHNLIKAYNKNKIGESFDHEMNSFINIFDDRGTETTHMQEFFSERVNQLHQSLTCLTNFGLNWEWREKVINAAMATGKTIHRFLEEHNY